MIWHRRKPRKEPECGEIRAVTRFLWLPKKINDEWQWLEKATWIERYDALYIDPVGMAYTTRGCRIGYPKWIPECWGIIPRWGDWEDYLAANRERSCGCKDREVKRQQAETRIYGHVQTQPRRTT